MAAKGSLMESIIGWSEEFGVNHTDYFSPDGGFRFFAWWERIISSMTLEDVECYLNIPELARSRENPLTRKLREVAITHRDRLLAVQKGAGNYAKFEQCVG